MKYTRIVQRMARASIALLSITVAAQAAIVTYNTNAPGTQFVGSGSLALASTGGLASATLAFTPNGDGDTSVPSNLNYGNFTLTCGTCSKQSGGLGATFDPFIFALVLTNLTTGGSGTFLGSSTGGVVYSDSSTINIDWVPLPLGSGTTNLDAGTFGSSIFTINATSPIVAPNSGQIPGQTTVQGVVITDSDFPIVDEVPEPATFGLIGVALLGLGIVRRKRVHSS